MNNNSVYSLLSLSARGGNIASGEFQTLKAIKENNASIVIVATDASDNTKKEFHDSCTFYNVPIVEFGDKESLGHAIGKDVRSSIAILNEGLAKSFAQKIACISENTEEINESK